MDSPRGRIYQMAQVAAGAEITDSYVEHIDLCLACRACETACPSGVKYGRLVEAARADIEQRVKRPLTTRVLRKAAFEYLLPSRRLLRIAATGLQACLRVYQGLGLKLKGRLGEMASLAPRVETPYFDRNIGKVFPATGEKKHRVAFLSGCIANVCFSRLNEATVRVLQANGCEVAIPRNQTCCGALHVHAGLREAARRLARQNIDALVDGGFDAIITNAGGCGSTLKEYDELLEGDAPAVTVFGVGEGRERISGFDRLEHANGRGARYRYLSGFVSPGARAAGAVRAPAAVEECSRADAEGNTERRSCAAAVRESTTSSHTDMSMALLEKKMQAANATGAERIVTSNPGCMLQLRAGVARWGRGQSVSHVVEILDEAYRNFSGSE